MSKDKAGYQKKKRDHVQRVRSSVVVVAIEDSDTNKTERMYFADFGADVKKKVVFVRGNETDPEQMIRNLIKTQNEIDFDPQLGDTAFCLIDADFDPQKDVKIQAASKTAAAANAKLILSAPSFEIWFVCHEHANTHQYRSSKGVIDAVKKVIPDYTKNKQHVYDQLKGRVATAIQNAKKLEKDATNRGKKKHTVSFTPSTEVYLLAEELLK